MESTTHSGKDLFKEEALPLIEFNNETQKFDVNQEVKEMLQNLKGPIGVIAVAGMYRTGKSYLLNRMLLNRQKGFNVGPSINPCTKGLWIWGTPISGFTPEGHPINVLVVDSEGIGGLDEDNNHDMRIFSLALLLASYFIYNSTGSIDENALSNLSLVVNITKHIQFKSNSTSQGEEGEEDMDNLLQYLPSFMWVVRDFALQLVDEQGNTLSSKEYFEKALQEKGSDQKNEIRKHLKLFFKERECCTMIRPLTNEDDLQELEHMELDELRAEFVEQVMLLRRKVINRIKPKTVNGQPMDGGMWIQLVEQYVHAINEGVVPNIHSSWTYICRQNANKAVDTCKLLFDQEVQEMVQLPMNQDDLESFLKEQHEAVMEKFQKMIKGEQEIVQEYQEELMGYLNAKFGELTAQNQMECRRYATDLLNQLFSEFETQLKQHQGLFDISQIDITLKEVSHIYDQNAIEFNEKQFLLSEAKATFLQDVLHQFNNQIESELKLQRQLDQQQRERLEQQLKEAKEESRNEKIKVEDRLKQVMLEKTELEAQHQVMKEQFQVLKASKEEDDKEYKEQINRLKEESSTQLDDYRQQKDEFEERLQQMQRHHLQAESEFDKERALFDQKVEFLEKALSEKQEKERVYMSELQNKKSEMSGELRQMCSKYESDIVSLQRQLEEEQEKYQEIENQMKERIVEMQNKESSWTEIENGQKVMITQLQEQVKSTEQTLMAIRRENDNKFSLQAREKDGKTEQYIVQIQELEQQLKTTTEQLKQKDHEIKKERALKDQKLQFLEMQLQDCKEQLEESYKQHEQMVRAMKHDISIDDGYKKKGSPDKDEFNQELERVHEEYQIQIYELKGQIEHYQEKVNELELQIKLNQSDFENERREFKQTLQEFDQQKQQFFDKIKQMEQQKLKLIEEQDRKYKQTVTKFEEELDLKTQAAQQELREMQDQSEESLAQLRNFYEIEKEKLEQRIMEERDKNTRRLANYQEELELRMRDDIQEKEDEIECLQNELRESEQRHQGYVTQMEHELSLKQQMLDTMERQVKESRERIELLELSRNSAFEKQIEHFEQQRQEYNHKIDKLQVENLEKDRQLAQMQHKYERLLDELERKKNEYEQSRSMLEKDKKSLMDKLENTKKKLAEIQDETMKQKLDYGREQALSKQQIEFQNKKIEELQKQLDDSQRFFDEKIKIYKADVQDEVQSQIERITSEKELWENKYEQKRRALKEIEQSLSKANSELEKKVSHLTQQIDRFEEDKRQMEDNYQEEIQNLQMQVQALDSSAGAAYYYGSAHAEDVLKLKGQVQDLERELSDLQSTYDRDKALWEGKCQFLETQKETYKRDLIEQQKKFEITLEQLQKRGSIDKDKFENNQQALIKVIESKYHNKIKEMMETHQCVLNESNGKVKRLENEIKLLNERIHMDQRGKQNEYGSLEKKVQDLQENEKRLMNEIDEMRMERDRRIQDYQRQIEKDRDTSKIKLQEYENKAKEAENKRSSLMFEFEKERAKWQLEKENIMNKFREQEDQIDKLSHRKEQLLKENERLKAENKGTKKQYLLQNSTNYPHIAQSTSLSSMGGQSTGSGGGHSSTSATRYNMMATKSISGAVGSNILSQAINKMKENNKYSMYGGQQSHMQSEDSSSHTTPITKHNRYGHQ